MLTLGAYGHYLEHHGLVFELEKDNGAARFASLSHETTGTAIAYHDTLDDARRWIFKLFEDYTAKSKVDGGYWLSGADDRGREYASVRMPPSAKPDFRKILTTPGLDDEYNVVLNNCQHWAERVWYHFGGPQIKGPFGHWDPCKTDYGIAADL